MALARPLPSKLLTHFDSSPALFIAFVANIDTFTVANVEMVSSVTLSYKDKLRSCTMYNYLCIPPNPSEMYHGQATVTHDVTSFCTDCIRISFADIFAVRDQDFENGAPSQDDNAQPPYHEFNHALLLFKPASDHL